MEASYSPLVSVIVVTYNSADYILETLESIKGQTYKNIELIVSDDCSSDKTLVLVRDWIDANKNQFVRTEVVGVDNNTGVTANYNRAINACKGEWVKNVDGDDLLLPTCIEENIAYVTMHPEAKLVLSNSIVFFDDSSKELIQKPASSMLHFFEMNAAEQYLQLMQDNILLNPNSQFTKTEVVKEIGYDERIRNMEDRPFFWNCSAKGVRFHYFDKPTVKYRKHQGALTGISGNRLISLAYYDSWVTFYYLVRKPEMERMNLDVSADERQILWYLIVKYIFKNRGNLLTKVLSKLLGKYLF